VQLKKSELTALHYTVGAMLIYWRDDLMMKQITQVGLAVALAFGALATSPQPAEARRGGYIAGGIAAGVIAGAILGSSARAYAGPGYYSYSAGPGCYRGPRECGYTSQRCYTNRFGDDVCRGGNYVCTRRVICD
jgi:uncharacterized membrane protein